MLTRLSIENLAIIERCEIEFEPRLNILTGETGAGKSILIGALNLILGDRASASDVRAGCRQARVEAVFELADSPAARKALEAGGLLGSGDDGEADGATLIVRREILATGKSRHFVNGAAVQLNEVRAIAGGLVDLHGQHQHQSLLDADTHREALDGFGDYGELLEQCARLHADFTQLQARLRALETGARETEREKDLLRYQIDELEAARLQPGEDAALETERNRLANAETLIASVRAAVDQLYEGESAGASAAQLLGAALDEVERLARIDATLAPLAEALGSARALIEDAAHELRSYGEGIEADPARLQEVDDRLAAIGKLKRKYGDTIEAMLAECAACHGRLGRLENREAEIAQTRRQLDEARRQLGETAAALSKKRRATAKRLAAEIEQQLAELNMPHAKCAVAIGQTDAADGVVVDGRTVAVAAHGADNVEFLISTNYGEEPRPLRKVASGGEISRIMLALKSIMAAKDRVPTLVFDEIDIGISGAVAARVGEKIERLAQTHQVLCITHLPQIAARGATHFRVEKATRDGRTVSLTRRLSDAERLDEIAGLFSGERATPESRKHARALLARG